MRENSAPLVNSAPTTPSSMKSGFSCYCNNSSTVYQNLWISVSCWCIIIAMNSKENPISLSQVLSGPSLPRGLSSPTSTVIHWPYNFSIESKERTCSVLSYDTYYLVHLKLTTGSHFIECWKFLVRKKTCPHFCADSAQFQLRKLANLQLRHPTLVKPVLAATSLTL